MADQRSISGTVKTEATGGKESVALKMMEFIHNRIANAPAQTDKKYWLTLYRQCYKAADGNSLESVLKED